MKDKMPKKVLERIALYHSLLVEYLDKNIEYISSPQIAERLKINDSQIRKDIKVINPLNNGKCRIGYSVIELKKSIEQTLGFSIPKNAFIIGTGNLGLALAKYDNFKNYGLNILALFDNDPLKVGIEFNGKKVHHISELPELISKYNVDIGILTIPREYSQSTADFMIKSGIKYIWNFSPTILKVPCEIKVWNENLIASFLQFTCNHIE